jgi:uncharacterized protein
MSDQEEKIMYIVTHGDDDPELATIPFVLANGALAMDVTPVIVLQSHGVMLAMKGFADHIFSAEMEPLKKLLDNYIQAGHQLLVCGPCIKKRQIKEDMLIDGAVVVGAGKLTEHLLEAKNAVTY